MTQLIEFYPATLAIAFAVLFVTTLFALLGLRRRLYTVQDSLERLATLYEQRAGGDDKNQQVSARALEKRLSAIATSVDKMTRSQLDSKRLPGAESLVDATALAKRGHRAEELCARCGISLGEAQLLVRLHGRTKAAA